LTGSLLSVVPVLVAGAKKLTGGSCDRAAADAARAVLGRVPMLAAQIVTYVAAFGEVCWQTDVVLHGVLRRPDGRPYHVESIGRSRRALARHGLLTSERVSPGEALHKKARHKSAHGTTRKSAVWSALGIRAPTRGERRRARLAQDRGAAYASRGAGCSSTPEAARSRPRYSAPVGPPPPMPPELARLAATVEARLEREWGESSASTSPRSQRPQSEPRGPDPPE
jgi:hypothetical protein